MCRMASVSNISTQLSSRKLKEVDDAYRDAVSLLSQDRLWEANIQ